MPRDERERDEVDLDDEDFDVEDDDADAGLTDRELIEQIVREQIEDSNAYIRKDIEQLNKRVDDVDHRVTNLEKIVVNMAGQKKEKTANAPAEGEQTGLDKFLDVTLGTAGRALHAVVDTVAFVGESIVDIVTLGRARQHKSS